MQNFFPLPKKLVICCATLLLMVSTLHAEVIDKVVAVVNNEVITLSELNAETAEIKQKIALTTPAAQQQQALASARDNALDSIIDKRLIAQKAAESRVSVSDAEIDQTVENVKKKARVTQEQFVAELQKSGLSLQNYRDNIKSQLLQRKIVNYDIRSKIVIPESELQKRYKKEYTIPAQKGDYYLQQIGFSAGESPESQVRAKELATRVHKLAVNGQDFGDLAEKYSTFPSAKDRGDIGFFALDDMSSAMADAIKDLKGGEISKILENPAGYQFFKVLPTTPENTIVTAPYEKVKEVIRAKIFEAKMQQEFSDWVTELKDSAYIQKL